MDYIDEAMQLKVPQDYKTIQDAVNFINGKTLNAPVDILVSDGEYSIDSSITPMVNNYHYLTIRGNEEDCSKCIILVDNKNNTDGFLFQDGYGISWLNGFTIRGTSGWISKGEWNDQTYGASIRAVNSGIVTLGSQIVSDKMYYAIRSMNGSYVINETSPNGNNKGGGIRAYNSGDVAFHAYGASLKVNCAEAYYTSHNEPGLGFGFCAEAGGFLVCEYAISQGNKRSGFYSLTNGSVWAHSVESSYNENYGILAWGGSIECNSLGDNKTIIHDNENSGIYSTYRGFVGANSAETYSNLHGVQSDFNSLVDATLVISRDNKQNGYYSTSGGSITGYNVTATNNSNNGFHCENGSSMNIPNPISSNNDHGYFCKNNSNIFCPGFGGDGNKFFCSPDQISVNKNSGNVNSYIIDIL